MAKKTRGGKINLDVRSNAKTVEELEATPDGVVKRWNAELEMSERALKDWTEESKKIYDKYESKQTKSSSFNILWANTEILAAAVYNSTPQPDIRRRFRDDDQLGKIISKILERSLSYEIDAYDFDSEVANGVLDLLLPGRGVVRVKYEPKFAQIQEERTAITGATGIDPAAAPAMREKLVDQLVMCEHVQWDDFRHGPGKSWRHVPWIAFRHDFTRQMAEEKFGPDIAAELEYSEPVEDEKQSSGTDEARAIFNTCEAWEIWDKDKKRVLFIAPKHDKKPLLEVADPLHLREFWPMPRPAYAIRNSRSLVPTPLYRLYEEQAKELDDITARIRIITRALKLRGAYNAAFKDLKKIIEADDNDMIPVTSPSQLEVAGGIGAMGGIDKNIWMMPVDGLIQVLRGLYESREQTKQTIYEILGIGDILRGASDPNETAAAQKIKSNWGSIRVQKVQKEIQRLVRDLMRIKAEIIAEHFTPEQLGAMSQVVLPTAQQKEEALTIMRAAQQAGQPVPPDADRALKMPSIEDVMGVLHSDQMRGYRIDIETDSTVAETIDRDMTGLGELLQSLSGWVQGAFQAVQQGAMTVDTMREIALAVIRRARLGSAVEDAFEQLRQPPPQQPDQGEQLAQMQQKILEIIKGEGARLAQSEANIMQHKDTIEQTVQQLGVGAQQLGAGAQATAQQAMAQSEATQVGQELLVEIAQLTQRLAAEDGGTRGQVQNAMSSVAVAMQTVMETLVSVAQGLKQVEEALRAPKTVKFTRGADNRINGGTATIN